MSLMGSLRFVLRLILTVGFSLLMYLLGAVVRLLLCVKRGAFYKPIRNMTSFWGYSIALIWGMKIKVSGTPPADPFFLVSNHISYTDIVLLCAVSPAWFVSKMEVASWPGIGALTRMGLTVFIDRETRRDVTRMNRLIADLVRNGGSVGFFPEGTTTDGNAIQSFKPSLLQPAVELGIPVTVAAITYSTPEGSPPPETLVAWVGDDEFAPHIKCLWAEPGFTAWIRFSEETIAAPDRKELSAACREHMITLHRELRKDVS